MIIDGFKDEFNLHEDKSSNPNLIVLYVSEACNLRCPMCLIWKSRDVFGNTSTTRRLLTFEDVKEIVRQVEPFKPMFYFIGGEPTINPDLMSIISYIHKKGMVTQLTTNGWLLPFFAKKLYKSGLDLISISLDGPDSKTHDKNRGVKGVFDRVSTGIKTLVKIKKENHSMFPNININTVVTPWNVDKLERIIKIAKTLEVDEMSFQNFSFFGREVQKLNDSYVVFNKTGKIIMGMQVKRKTPFSEISIKKISSFLKNLPKLSKKYDLLLYNFPNVNNHQKYYAGEFPSTITSYCYRPWHVMTIRGSGDLEICQGYVAGNIRKEKLMEIWNNTKYKYFRKIIKKDHMTPACYRCCYLKYSFT